MRYLCAAFAMLIVSAAAASAQSFVVLNPPTRAAMAGGDVVVDRLMSFDRDRDGLITATELSERMQGLVARGDRSGDGALDAYEIRLMASSSPFGVNSLSSLSGSYGFGDSVGQSSRTHIENSIDDLRLAPRTTQEVKRLASAFVDEFEGQPLTNPQLDDARRSALVSRLSGVLTEEEGDNLRAALARRPLVKRPGVDHHLVLSQSPVTAPAVR